MFPRSSSSNATQDRRYSSSGSGASNSRISAPSVGSPPLAGRHGVKRWRPLAMLPPRGRSPSLATSHSFGTHQDAVGQEGMEVAVVLDERGMGRTGEGRDDHLDRGVGELRIELAKSGLSAV